MRWPKVSTAKVIGFLQNKTTVNLTDVFHIIGGEPQAIIGDGVAKRHYNDPWVEKALSLLVEVPCCNADVNLDIDDNVCITSLADAILAVWCFKHLTEIPHSIPNYSEYEYYLTGNQDALKKISEKYHSQESCQCFIKCLNLIIQ